MGIREIRYCDISGSEDDVAPHELHIDQLRIELDLADTEYHKLLKLLQPYMDAGRLEPSAPDTASLPSRPGRRRRPSSQPKLTGPERQQLREWAQANDIETPTNNRFKTSLIDQWRADTTATP